MIKLFPTHCWKHSFERLSIKTYETGRIVNIPRLVIFSDCGSYSLNMLLAITPFKFLNRETFFLDNLKISNHIGHVWANKSIGKFIIINNFVFDPTLHKEEFFVLL